MISESDVFIADGAVLTPLVSSHRAWLYWVEPALYGGQTFAMSFTTLSKADWRVVLANTSSCQQVIIWIWNQFYQFCQENILQVLAKFPEDAGQKTLDNWGVNNGKHWESDQNIVSIAPQYFAAVCTVVTR